MTHPSGTLESPPRRAVAALALATVVVGSAIGGAPGRRWDAPLMQLPAATTSPFVRARSAVAANNGLRALHALAPRGATRTPDLTATLGPIVTRDLTGKLGPSEIPNLARRGAPALDPPPQPGPFAIDLYDKGDFVSQSRVDWCVPASILSMMRMIDLPGERAAPTQAKLDRLARSLSSSRLRGAGSEPEGWAGSLNRLGYGPYEVRAERTRRAAIATAARAIRLTGRPVGLLVWRGAHAWVVSGFRATADPAYTDDFVVTHLSVLDPWYPRVSSIWGASKSPDASVPVRLVAKDYVAWRRPAVRYLEKDGRFVLLVPVADVTAVSAVDLP